MRHTKSDQKKVDRYRVSDPGRLAYTNGLVNQHQEAVVKWAVNRYRKKCPHVSPDDIAQETRLAVLYASRTYDGSRGPFWYYVRFVVSKAFAEFISKNYTDIALPVDWQKKIRPLTREMRKHPHLSYEDVLSFMDIPETQRSYIRDIYRAVGRSIVPSLDGFHPVVYEDTLDSIVSREETDRFNREVSRLPLIYQEVIIGRFSGESVASLARRLGITFQTVYRKYDVGIEWLSYFVGEGPEPTSRLRNLTKKASSCRVRGAFEGFPDAKLA
jgi:RNA polymerase sigma factor (sigma-70 family)